MSHTISCYVLFDVTRTGITVRSKQSGDKEEWLHSRNTQCNLDTILQVISMRSQPEAVTAPKLLNIKFNEFDKFGFLFDQTEDETYACWNFTFSVQHSNVFDDGINTLGLLNKDCDGVPMIKCSTSWDKLPTFLDTSDELRNIYFELIEDED